jgi:Arc/MetJ family transcription regulator
MKKTTVFLDEELISEAMEETGAASQRAVIEAGLRLLIRNQRRRALIQDLGTFDLALTRDELEEMRDAE